MLERALVWYARHFPLARDKLRLINAAWPLVAGAGPNRTAALIYGGFRAPCDLRDMLQRQFYFFGTYRLERDLLACWSRLAARARVVFDVGANSGIYSLAALAANPRGEVHAFEPTPEIADRLRATAEMNGLAGLAVSEVAVCDVPGEATLVRCQGDNGTNEGMNFVQKGPQPDCARVAADTLDHFCSLRGIEAITLLKLDIQGGEAAALEGAANLLREGRIETVFLELNWIDQVAHCPASETIALSEKYGFLFCSPDDWGSWRKAGPWLRELTDVIASGQGSPPR